MISYEMNKMSQSLSNFLFSNYGLDIKYRLELTTCEDMAMRTDKVK